MKDTKNTLKLIFAMTIFGTIGIFRNYIPFPSGFVAMARGFIGVLSLLLVMLISRKKLCFSAIRENLILLVLSGAFIGINWILLFEAYRYTSVASATLCYYMAPVFVIFASPLVLRERLTLKKCLCAVVAIVGMSFVSGIFDSDFSGVSELIGIFFGLGAAVFYATVILLNKKMKNIDSYDMTATQLFVSAAVILPYTLIAEDISREMINPTSVILLITVGIVHTGIAYALYFGSVNKLNTQKVALFGYIDPVVAIILSALVLKDELTVLGIIGATMILLSMIISEFSENKQA